MISIEERFANISTYSEGGQPSLYKPLLLLFALGNCFLGRERMISFSIIDSALIRLFDEFYPAASERANTHYPFGRLESDGIWELEQSAILSRTSVGHLFKGELLEKNIHAGLSLEVFQTLSADKNRLINIASQLLHRYFPESQHAALREAVGLPQSIGEVRGMWMEYYDSTMNLPHHAPDTHLRSLF
jgi:predicted restriction endonuclease